MFNFGKQTPDETKREVGYGAITVRPYLFVKSADFFKELRDKVLPYLTKEEEEEIVCRISDGREGFKVFIPKDTFDKISKGSIVMKTATLTLRSGHDEGCFCGDQWTNGCCGGVAMGVKATQELLKALRNDGYKGKLQGETFKNYFIIRPDDVQNVRREDL